jgi:N-glycosylase/DNA lyase
MTGDKLKILQVKDFSLKETIESGQYFTYEFLDDFYYIVCRDKVFKVKQEKDLLLYFGIDEENLIDFFNLNLDLKKITMGFEDDKYLKIALDKYWGLRLINQDLWQCMIGFVCSSCSNIPKIKKNLYLICKFFGKKVEFDGKRFYTFPEEGKINDLEKLKEAKTGYRAEYIYEINKIVLENPELLEKIRKASYEDAKRMLMEFKGIGEKVADCICLFALGCFEAFPVDTWIKQVIEKLYLGRKAKSEREIREFACEYFRENKGLKQQYLFHYMRNLE